MVQKYIILDNVQIFYMKTEDKILAKALELFNERGIEYVGLRELAGILDLRVGNITYYFATKDDLVNRISLELNLANESVLSEKREPGLYTFLDNMRLIFKNHMKYRCITLSLVHILDRNAVISERFKKTQRTRSDYLATSLSGLVAGGWLKWTGPEDSGNLISTMGLLARFWVSDASIILRNINQQEQMKHYLRLLVSLLKPHLTAKGKKDAFKFMDEL